MNKSLIDFMSQEDYDRYNEIIEIIKSDFFND